MSKTPVLNIQTWRTTGNIPVYFVHTPGLPMLDIRVVFNAGSARDADKPGLADLTNALLDEGTQQLSADDIAKRFDEVGAIYRAAIRQDMASVGIRSLTSPQFLTSALDTFVQILTQPIFSQEAFLRVQKQLLTGLEAEQQQPATVAQKAFYAQLYGSHPYAHPLAGTIDTISQLTREDVSNFYQRYYTAENAMVVLVGNITTPEAEQIVKQIVQDLPSGEAAQPIAAATSAAVVHHAVEFPSQQTTIYMGQVAITPQDDDFFPLLVGNYTLGSGGMVSRLFNEVREKHGLVYGIHSYFLSMKARGPFAISLQTRNEETQRAIAMTQHLLTDYVHHGPTASELLAAKRNIVGSFPLELASNSDILMQVMKIAFYELSLDYLDTYRDRVNAVSMEDIRTAFQRHVQPDKLVMVTVGEITRHDDQSA